MYTIPAEIIIANYFAEASDSTVLTMQRLAEIQKKIEEEFRGIFLFVDLTRDSLADAVNHNTKYFSFNDSRTAIVFNSSQREDLYQDVYLIYNSRLEIEIKSKLSLFLEKILAEPAVS